MFVADQSALDEAKRRAPKAAAAPQVPHAAPATPAVPYTKPPIIAGLGDSGSGDVPNYGSLRIAPQPETTSTPTEAVSAQGRVAPPPSLPQPFQVPPIAPPADTKPSIPAVAPLAPVGPASGDGRATAGQGIDESGGVIGDPKPADTAPSIPSAGGAGGTVAPFGPNGYANLTEFGPGHDLRSTQINPVFEPKYEGEALGLIRGARVDAGAPIALTDTSQAQRLYGAAEQAIQGATLRDPRTIADTDLTGARSIADQARQAILAAQLKDFYGVAGPDFTGATADLDRAGTTLDGVQTGFSPEALAARAAALKLLQSLDSTPSKSEIAQDRLDLFNERSQPVLQDQLRTTGQANAALGRLGSGMVRDDLRSAVTEMDRNRSQYAKELAADTAEQELSDQIAKLGAVNGAGSTFFSQDQSQAALQMALAAARQQLAGGRANLATSTYQAAANERDADLANSQAQAALALSRGGALSGQADQEARFAGIKRADDENNRAYDLAYDTSKAGLDLNRGAALQQLGGSNLDLARVLRADQVGERDYLTDIDRLNAALDLSKSGALLDIDNTRFGQGAEMRGELRGERDYQSTLAQLAIDNAARQQALQDQLANSQFGRQMAYLQTLLAAGRSGSDGSGAMDTAGQLAYINELMKKMGGSAGVGSVGTTYAGANGGLA